MHTAFRLPLRKFFVLLFAAGAFTSLYNGTFLAYLAEWLPLIGILIFLGFIIPVSKLKSLSRMYKTPILVLGAIMIVWGISDLFGAHRTLLDLFHSVSHPAHKEIALESQNPSGGIGRCFSCS